MNQQYGGPDTKLRRDGDEIALLPPVSGGSGAARRLLDSRWGHWPYARITRDAIDTNGIVDSLKRGEDGAALFFERIVRNSDAGRKTIYLKQKRMKRWRGSKWSRSHCRLWRNSKSVDLAIVHRLGRLEIGENQRTDCRGLRACAAVKSDACRWLIDTLKRTVPIWKS